MANVRDQAVKEFRKKLAFERELLTKLQKFDKQIVRAFTRELGLSGNIIQASRFDEELIDILTTHYKNVGGEFSDQVKLPKDVAETDEERDQSSLVGEPFLVRYQRGRISSTLLAVRRHRSQRAGEAGRPRAR